MTNMQIVSITLQLWGCLISVLIAVFLYFGKRFHVRSSQLYLVMLILNTLSMLFDVLAIFLHHFFLQFGSTLLWIVYSVPYACNILLMPAFIHYIQNYLQERNAKVSSTALYVVRAIAAMLLICLLANRFHPLIFGLDRGHLYYRGDFFCLTGIECVVGIGISIYWILKYRRILQRSELLALSSYVLLPMAAIPVQALVSGVAWINLAATLEITLIYLCLQVHQSQRIAAQETALMESRYNTAINQIQPHFLFNALNSIQYLCKTDPSRASLAITHFADYLRVNMDSLTCRNPVPLSFDLEHLENYLSIERLRFPDIDIRFHLETTDFMVPSLTLQPLVENAIKHGISQLREGGIITISSWEDDETYYLEVKDNGGGFRTSAMSTEDNKKHLGLSNTRTRLDLMCRGTLQVESRAGKGVTARIQIPKEGI